MVLHQTQHMARLQVPPGCSRYTVNLSRPLGLVLETNGSSIVVAEVQKGGLAEREGTVRAGDILISTSGITYSKESDYGGAKVRMGESRVILNVSNEVCSRPLLLRQMRYFPCAYVWWLVEQNCPISPLKDSTCLVFDAEFMSVITDAFYPLLSKLDDQINLVVLSGTSQVFHSQVHNTSLVSPE
jgi:hypothetical protein